MLARAVAVVVMMAGMSGIGMAQSRRDVVAAASKLRIEPAKAARELRAACGCSNTARILSDISLLGLNLEMVARFSGPAAVHREFERIVRKALEIEQYIVNVPREELKLRAYESYLIGVNEIGAVLFQSSWVPILAQLVYEVRYNSNGQSTQVPQIIRPNVEGILDLHLEIDQFDD